MTLVAKVQIRISILLSFLRNIHYLLRVATSVMANQLSVGVKGCEKSILGGGRGTDEK